MSFRLSVSVALALAASLFSSGLAGAQTDPLTNGRDRSEAFLSGNIEPLWRDMTADMKTALGDVDALPILRSDLEVQLGAEARILTEEVIKDQGFDVYMRTARWSKSEADIIMQWTFDANGQIAGFFVRPKPAAAPSRYLDYQTRTRLTLPFAGEWYVYWGGRTLMQNYHAVNQAQRFASDLVIRKDGASFAGDPSQLASYHCWDTPILAPADGTIVTAVSNMPDLPIGQTDPRNPAGNHVVIDLGNGEFAFLAHFRQGSVAVKPGGHVSRGQEVARCGNSGNTSEPHLHFHLQTTPDLTSGEGLPAIFESFLAGGAQVARGELSQGQSVRPAEASGPNVEEAPEP